MKKNIKFITSLCFLACVVGCGTVVSSSSSTPIENITGVEIAGPISVVAGKTIPLIADVVGSENENVTWTSSNPLIATVNEEGVVTGVSEGTVTITATSVASPNYFASYEVTVTLPKLDEIKLVVETKEDITQNAITGVYNVPLGQTFKINLETVPTLARKPDSINYEVIFPDGTEATNAFTVEIQPDNTAEVNPYGEISGVAIKATATYNDFATGAIISSAYFNVYDKNIEEKTQVLDKVKAFREVEKTSLISSKVVREKEVVTSTATSQTTETINHLSFSNVSYTDKTTISNGSSSTTHLYNGIDKNTYFVYEYDNALNITEMYENTASTANNQTLATLYCDKVGGTLTYGHSEILNKFFNLAEPLVDNIVTFGESRCYAYSEYSLNDDTYIITSKYEDDDASTSYDVKLTINFGANNIVTGYTFEETAITIHEDEKGNASTTTTNYKETASDFVYGTKTSDSSYDNRLDMSNYYFTSFDIIDIAGTKDEVVVDNVTSSTYDYTSNKYGADLVETDPTTGLKKYITTYDRTLVFKIGNPSPATATTKIDMITSSSSDPSQIPNVEITTAGIIAINAKKDDAGLSLPGTSTFTFSSKNGFYQSIVVEFYAVNVNDLIVTNIDASNDLGTIFKNELTNYFFLNTNPDEARYSFGITMIDGDTGGIELYKHSDDNLDGIPGFSYSILGKKTGAYRFKFHVTQDTSITSENEYTLTVVDAYTAKQLEEKLVSSDALYVYNTGTTKFELKFTNSTTITFTETTINAEKIVQNIYYTLVDGAIMIDANQKLSASKSYFSRIKEGKAPFIADLKTGEITSIKLYLQTTAQSEDEDIKIHYSPYTFTKSIDITNLDTYLNGKTLTTSFFIIGIGMTNVSLIFNNGVGTLTFVVTATSETYATTTFTYTYYPSYLNFVASNINSSNSSIENITYIDYIESDSLLRLTMYISGSREVLDFSL